MSKQKIQFDIDTHPEVKQVREALRSLKDRKREIDQALNDAIQKGRDAPEHVVDTLAGEGYSAEAMTSVLDVQGETQRLEREQCIVEQAIERAEARYDKAKRDAGVELADAAKPAYSELVRQMAEHVEALAKLAEQERRFIEDAKCGGVRVSRLHVKTIPWAVSDGTNPSQAERWLREAREYHSE
ncbi:hypothetical protein ACERK3_02245 [Phycisphaerales bacterium AB-hyl4]|uniref:Uncharacterized protein n=1 Tax=Natronomicrosphaera hydrolytica TaxID=3242702 RepID=A0ABV4U0H5_9BACT